MVTGTGEHGVGIGKREYLYDELGDGTVNLMKTVKNAIDPHNLFNPGKASLYSAVCYLGLITVLSYTRIARTLRLNLP